MRYLESWGVIARRQRDMARKEEGAEALNGGGTDRRSHSLLLGRQDEVPLS